MEHLSVLLWINLCLVIFYGFYWLFLKKETFHEANRYYLLITLVLSFILPFINWSDFSSEIAPLIYDSLGVVLPEVVVRANNELSTLDLFLYAHAGVSCLLLARLFIIYLKTKARFLHEEEGDFAYSFLGQMKIGGKYKDSEVVYAHEEVHVDQYHTLDLFLVEIVKAFLWLNPFVYFYRRSLSLTHEYIADKHAKKHMPSVKAYAAYLISQHFGTTPETLCHSFKSNSGLKERITMLAKKPSKKASIAKFSLVVPLLIILTSFISLVENYNERKIKAEKLAEKKELIRKVEELLTEGKIPKIKNEIFTLTNSK